MQSEPDTRTIDLTDGMRAFRLTTRLPGEVVDRLVHCIRRPDLQRDVLILSHPPADGQGRDLYLQARLNNPGYRAYVARLPVPTVLPPGWRESLAAMDEIWVPSRTGREVLVKAGLAPEKVAIVPPVVAVRDGEDITPYPLHFQGRETFALLTCVDAGEESGWTEVVRAWLNVFEPEEPVALVLAPRPGGARLPLQERVAACIRAMGRDPADIPEILLVEEAIPLPRFLSLCLAVNGVVVPRDEDERGLVALYAMAAGIAPLGRRDGPLRHLLHPSRAFPITADLPLEGALRRLCESSQERARRGLSARDYVVREHASAPVAGLAAGRLERLAQRPGAVSPRHAVAVEAGTAESISADRLVGNEAIRVGTRADYRALLARGVAAERLLYRSDTVPAAWLREPVATGPDGSGDFHFLCLPEEPQDAAWETLVTVYARAYHGGSPVNLRLFVPPATVATTRDRVLALLAGGSGARRAARVEVLPAPPAADRSALLAGVGAVVVATRSGRASDIARRALAAGVPLIVSGFADHLDLCGEPGVARLVAMRPLGEGSWEPDALDLGRALEEAVGCKGVFRGMGERARDEVARACTPRDRVGSGSGTDPASVVFEGPVFRGGSQAIILRELVRGMLAAGAPAPAIRHTGPALWPPDPRGAEAELLPHLVTSEQPGAAVVVRGGWPPVFRQPLAHRFVLRIDWEWGRIPLAWLAPLAGVDEIWVHTEHVRRTFLDSGVAPEKVVVMPHGVDPGLFRPEGPILESLAEQIGGRHALLFVGGALFRKGLDLLLGAYGAAFTRDDPVCLVVKEVGAGDFYEDAALGRLIDRFMATRGAPTLIKAPDDLTAEGVGALYRTCHTLVHPYRGEGFGLPVLEAMASGRPVIATQGGATDDFAVGESVLALPAARREVDLGEPCVGLPWVLEPDQAALAALMQRAVVEAEALRSAAAVTARQVAGSWTWERSGRRAAARLAELAGQPVGNIS